jgi:hypothetical protein
MTKGRTEKLKKPSCGNRKCRSQGQSERAADGADEAARAADRSPPLQRGTCARRSAVAGAEWDVRRALVNDVRETVDHAAVRPAQR